jgi:preprotein translocase subunit SecA
MARLLKQRGSAKADTLPSRAKRGEAEVLRWCREVVSQVNALEPRIQTHSDDALRALTGSFRDRLSNGEPVDALLPEAFAAVREAAARTLGQRHFDAQIMGGAVLHLGNLAEMRTGEGKTLTATLPAYLHALTGSGVHVLTANDFLASRDAEWMGPVYRFLGLTVGLLVPEQRPDPAARRDEYSADVTYGPWDQFGYDYLRDNLAWDRDEIVQRGHGFAIIDEADLILLDEMRTPLTITGPAKQAGPASAAARHAEYAALAARLERGAHYDVDEDAKTVSMTERGTRAAEEHFGVGDLYAEPNLPLVLCMQNALAAKECYLKDRDYVVTGGQAVIIDRMSGRLNHGRRYSDGVHEAIEAKEGLDVRVESQQLATMPIWDYLGEYDHLAAMTGTATADAEAYRQLYRLDVVTIPTNRPMIRVDHADAIYGTEQSKLAALADETATRHAAGQPVLIGAMSIEQANDVSGLLAERGVAHEVLTALNQGQEAQILAAAGRLDAVTVVAKMAGRGVDIVLGGADGTGREPVADAGGLCVLGAERPAMRRLEMHLRGRAGRQGDPGEAKFFVSFDDYLMKLALGTKQASFWSQHSKDGQASAASSYGVSKAQAKVAAHEATSLFRSREFDRVLTQQRRLIYADRAPAVSGHGLSADVRTLIDRVAARSKAGSDARLRYQRFESEAGPELIRKLECRVVLSVIDQAWREHLQAMAELLKTITTRTTGDAALAEYRRDAELAFNRMRQAADVQIAAQLLTFGRAKPGAKRSESGDAVH